MKNLRLACIGFDIIAQTKGTRNKWTDIDTAHGFLFSGLQVAAFAQEEFCWDENNLLRFELLMTMAHAFEIRTVMTVAVS